MGCVYRKKKFKRRILKEGGFAVRESPLYSRSIYSGTEVRRRMVADEDWRSLVPKAVAKVVDDIDGVGRVKDINVTDSGI